MKDKRESLLTETLLQDQIEEEQQQITFLSILRFANDDERIYMIAGTVSAILTGITFPFFLMFFGQITDIFNDMDHAAQKGFNIMVKFLIIGSVYWIFSFLSLYWWSFSGSTQSMRMKKLYYQTLLEQEVAWYDSIDVGKLASTIAKNISIIQNAIGQKVALLISATFTSSFGIVFAFVHCWQLSLFLIAILPVVVYSGFLLMKSHALRAKINNASYQKASGIAEQAFSSIRTIKYLVGETFEVARFQQALKFGNKKAMKYIALVAISYASFYFVTIGIYSIGMWLGKQVLLWNLDSGKYSAADIVGSFFCVVSGGSAFGQISPILKNLAQGKVAFAEMMTLINRNKSLIQTQNGKKIKKIKQIRLRNVSFAYKRLNEPNEAPSILKDISIKFTPYKVNAIVGQSGSGKSTIAQLLLRYYDCQSGSISINGHNIIDINTNNFRRKIGFVGQEPVLFAMSIEDNLKIAAPKITEEEIINALKKANAWEFVNKMQKGIKTYVGAGGIQLSGGQKQRIAIARAICKKPQLLVLDEATSALDRKNEKEIQLTLQNLQDSNITTIVIAHRLSTIKAADTIFVLQKGELIEYGNHETLLNKHGVYSRLVHTQLQAQKKGCQNEGDTQKLQKNHISDIQYGQALDEDKKDAQEKQEKIVQKQIKQEAVFRKILRQSRTHMLFVVIGAVGSLANGMVVPFFSIAFGTILALLNDVVANESEIDQYCLYFFLIALASASTSFLYNLSFGIVGDRVVHDLRLKTFQKLLKLPVSYYDKKQNTPGTISTKLSTEAYQIHNMITGIIAVISLNTTISITGLLIAFIHCWKIALITLAFTPFLMVSTSISVAIIKRMSTKSQRSQKFIGSLISDTVSNIRTVKSFGKSTFFINKFEENLQQLNKVAFQRSIKISFFQGMRRALIIVAEGLILWIGGLLYSQGNISETKDAIFISIFAIIYCSNTIGQTSQYMPDIARARRAGAIIFDILQNTDEEENCLREGGLRTDEIRGQIEFRDVCFKYPSRENMVLQNFTLNIKEGEKIGLVGESGSGKSTVLQLLLRIYQPESGSIFIDRVNIKEYNLYSLRKQLGIVNQEPTMFLGTVDSNIRYNQSPTERQFASALSTACCNRFVSEWQQGLQKQVGQKGSQISGGQKQRIAMARCLIRKPTILLLDESTSALDAETQSNLLENLSNRIQKTTTICIAHRLSTVKQSSRIIVMRDGRIIESGTYLDLMTLRAGFYKLAQGQ